MKQDRFDYTHLVGMEEEPGNISRLHEKLAALLRRKNSELSGRTIISERQAADSLGVCRMTVHKIYEKLTADGLLAKAPGSRCYQITAFDVAKSGQCIGLVLPCELGEYLRNANYTEPRLQLFLGLADRAAELKLGILPTMLPPAECRRKEVRDFFDDFYASVIGVAHLGPRGEAVDSVLDFIWRNRTLPQVCLLFRNQYMHCGSVLIDEQSALQSVAGHLRERGYRSLTLIYPALRKVPRINYVLESLFEARQIFAANGMETRDEWSFELNDSDTERALRNILPPLLSSAGHPRAFWCRNDHTALILMRLLEEMGKSVPHDYVVLGMDNSRAAAAVTPGLTSTQIPFYQCGRLAVELLVEMRNGTAASPYGFRRKLPTQLVLRESTNCTLRNVNESIFFN